MQRRLETTVTRRNWNSQIAPIGNKMVVTLDLKIYKCFITTFHKKPAVYSRLVTSNPVTIVCSLQNYELKQV